MATRRWRSLRICLAVSTQYRRVTDRQTDEETSCDGIVHATHSTAQSICRVISDQSWSAHTSQVDVQLNSTMRLISDTLRCIHLSHGFQCSPTLNRQPYEGRLPLTSWWRKSSNMTIGQSSLISLAHHCYDWHPGSRCVLVARPRRCLTLSNPVPSQNWMAAYLGYTLRMKTLFRGWPVMTHETHTRRRITVFPI